MSAAFDVLEAEMQELRLRLRAALAEGNGVDVQACRAELERLETAWHALTGSSAGVAGDHEPSSTRERVLHTLALIGVPASHSFIQDVHRHFYGGELNTKAMASLRRDEERSIVSTGNHHVHVCAALTADTFGVARGLLAHSAWPLQERIIAPTSRRVNALRAVIRVTEATERLSADHGGVPPVHNLFRGVPEILEFDAIDTPIDSHELRTRAQQALAAAVPADTESRSAAARRAREQLDPLQQLFGARRN